MRLYATQGFGGEVIDLDTGLKVRKVSWIDTDPPGFPPGVMLLEAWQTDQDGNILFDHEGALFYQAKGRFKIIKNEQPKPVIKIRRSAPNCVKCGSLLTLPGYDLCAFCNSVDKGTIKFKVDPVSPFEVVGCQRLGCNRQAAYQVSDEVEAGDVASNTRFGKLVFDRAATVNRRWYCAFHYKPPRILDPKGEVIEVLEDRRTI